MTPVSGVSVTPRIEVSGEVSLPETEHDSSLNFVSPGWFSTFGTPLVVGRDLSARDRKGALSVVVVNQAFARRFLNGASPLGHTISTTSGPTARTMEIVGVVADAVYRSLREPVPPTMYVPLAQFSGPAVLVASLNLGVRSSGASPALLTKSVASAIAAMDSELVLTLRLLAEQVDASIIQERVVAMLSGFFGALALLLAALGLYGVTSYAVTRRRTELGIRMALGAAPGSVVRLVLSRVCVLVALGVVIGGVVSLWASRLVAPLLYGLEPRDRATLVGSAVVLATVGALAAWLPAWRASRIDPAVVLRNE